MPAKKRLSEFFEHVTSGGELSRFEALRILPLARELLEQSGSTKQYAKIRFYGDWSLHPQLDRESAKLLMSEIAKVFQEHSSSPPDRVIKGVSQVLSVASLRAELIQLFTHHSIPTYLFELQDLWRQYISWLLQDLIEKPIVGSQFTAQEMATGLGSLTTPRVLRLIAEDEPGSPIKWCVEMGPLMRVHGIVLVD